MNHNSNTLLSHGFIMVMSDSSNFNSYVVQCFVPVLASVPSLLTSLSWFIHVLQFSIMCLSSSNCCKGQIVSYMLYLSFKLAARES